MNMQAEPPPDLGSLMPFDASLSPDLSGLSAPIDLSLSPDVGQTPDAAAAQCMNGVRDGDETDIDCGGMTCPTCALWSSCKVNGDCDSGRCHQGLCIASPDLGLPPDLSMPPDMRLPPDLWSKPDLAGVFTLRFAAPAHIALGTSWGTIVSGDWDADGKVDLALCIPGVAKLQTLLGQGDGTFKIVKDAAPVCDDRLTATRVDADKRWDLVVGSGLGAEVLISQGDGTFKNTAHLTTKEGNPTGTNIAFDFNNDGKTDVVTPKFGLMSSELQFFAGNGDGTFAAGAVADLPTILNGNYKFNNRSVVDFGLENGGGALKGFATGLMGFVDWDFVSRGDGTFTGPVGVGPAGRYVSVMRPIDQNFDGKLDGVGYVTSTGKGGFLFGGQTVTNTRNASSCFVQGADLDGDGQTDWVLVDSVSDIYVYLSKQQFAETLLTFPDALASVALGDFNGDHLMDLAAVNVSKGGIEIFLAQ